MRVRAYLLKAAKHFPRIIFILAANFLSVCSLATFNLATRMAFNRRSSSSCCLLFSSLKAICLFNSASALRLAIASSNFRCLSSFACRCCLLISKNLSASIFACLAATLARHSRCIMMTDFKRKRSSSASTSNGFNLANVAMERNSFSLLLLVQACINSTTSPKLNNAAGMVGG